MSINLNIKAHVSNLSLCEIFELLNLYGKTRPKDGIMFFDGKCFRIESSVSMSIDYEIFEIND